MAEILSPSDLEPSESLDVETPETSDDVVEASSDVPGSRRDSILDRIRKNAEAARENRTIDLALPDNIPGSLGLRLGIPREVHGSLESDAMGMVDLGRDIRELSTNIVAIVEFDDREWKVVDGLSIEEVAIAYGTVLRGSAPAIVTREQAVREVFTSGTPPQVEPHALSSSARLYRRWALDPTLALLWAQPTSS